MDIKPEDLTQFNAFKTAVANNATEKGFRGQMFAGLDETQIRGPIGTCLAVSVYCANEHGEVSELWESFRAGTLHEPCDKAEKMKAAGLPALTSAEEEIADIIIRALDTADFLGVDVARALAVKHAYNRTRPKLHGGKKA